MGLWPQGSEIRTITHTPTVLTNLHHWKMDFNVNFFTNRFGIPQSIDIASSRTNLNDLATYHFIHVCGELQLWAKPITTHDVTQWNSFPRDWPFVQGIQRSPMNSPNEGQWRGALVLSLIYAGINDWVNGRKAVDLRRHRVHYVVTVMSNYILDALVQHLPSCWTHSCILAPTPLALYTCKWLQSIIQNWCTVQCRYSAANFLQIPYNRHPIAHPWGRGMGCVMWVQNLIKLLLLLSQGFL